MEETASHDVAGCVAMVMADPDNRIYVKYTDGVHRGCRVSVLDAVPAAFTMDGTTRLPLVSADLRPVTFVKWDDQARNQPCKCPDYNPTPPI